MPLRPRRHSKKPIKRICPSQVPICFPASKILRCHRSDAACRVPGLQGLSGPYSSNLGRRISDMITAFRKSNSSNGSGSLEFAVVCSADSRDSIPGCGVPAACFRAPFLRAVRPAAVCGVPVAAAAFISCANCWRRASSSRLLARIARRTVRIVAAKKKRRRAV